MHVIDNAKGFIFDCDGTLLDTLDAWGEAERELFAQAGELTQEQEDELHSAPIERAAEIFHNRYGVLESADAVLAHLDGYLLPFYGERSEAIPGSREFVRTVHATGLPCVVLSSSPRRYLEAGLKRAGILDCFIQLLTTDEVGCSKQDVAIYERALEVLNAAREDVWAIDDAPYAVGAMSNFGLNTIGVVAGSSAERKARLAQRADIVVDTLDEISLEL